MANNSAKKVNILFKLSLIMIVIQDEILYVLIVNLISTLNFYLMQRFSKFYCHIINTLTEFNTTFFQLIQYFRID